MNILRLGRYLYSKRLKQEILLMCQLVLMVVLGFSVLNPIEVFLQKSTALESVYSLDFSRTYHFSSGNALSSESNEVSIYDAISSVPGVSKVLRSSVTQIYYDTGMSSYHEHSQQNEPIYDAFNLIVYNPDLMGSVQLSLAEGTFDAPTEQYLPIVISSSLAERFPIGSTEEVYLNSGEEKVTCIVTGVLTTDSAIPAILKYGSVPSLDVLAAYTAFSSGYDFAVACYHDELLGGITWDNNYLITVNESANSDQVLQSIIDEVGLYGNILSLDEIINLSFNDMLRSNRWFIFAFFLLSLIAIFGVGGYVFLMMYQRQAEFSVFYMLGMSKKQMALIICSVGCTLLSLALLISSCITPIFIRNVLGGESASPGIFSYLFCGVLFGLIITISVAAGIRQSNKVAVATLYQRRE